MNSLRSGDRGSIGELVQAGGMSAPQAAVNTSGSQGAVQATSSVTPTPTESSPSVSDIKLFYFNKPPEGEHKSSSSISLSNGVSPKVVQIPGGGGGGAASNPGGFAYLGTLIKQGRETGEGQKVLLTPVIKDGGRFILPRTALAQRSGANSTSASTQNSEHIYLSQSQQPRRSFVIHNSSLSGKDVGKGIVDSGTVVPKVLPPPKVPLVVCSSRAHDVTLTSVKPIAPKEDSSRATLDVGSLRTLVCKEPMVTTSGSDVSSLLSCSNSSSGSGSGSQHDSTDVTLTTIRDLPPLTPITHNSLSPSKSDADDVEVVGDCEMPRPIVKKVSLKSLEPVSSSVQSQSISVLRASSTSETIELSPSSESESTSMDCEVSQCESDSANCGKSVTEPDSPSKEIRTLSKQLESTLDSSSGSPDGKVACDKVDSSPVATSKGLSVSGEPTIITDPNVLILKAKSNISGIKVSGTNGHFVRILSAPPSTEGKEGSNASGTVYFKDGKAVVFGNLAKELNNLKELQTKDKETATDESGKEKEVSSGDVCSGDQVKESSNVGSHVLTTTTKLVQKSFSIRIPSSPSLDPQSKVTSSTGVCAASQTKVGGGGTPVVPGGGTVAAGGGSHLQIKELSKESAMQERSRKRKGAPLLRDCFKKTIAVKRLEPLPGAVSVEPLQVIEWDPVTGVGALPGSDIKFVLNCYGALQVYEGDGIKTTTTKPVSGVDVVYANDSFGKDDIGRCIECECYGLLVEFIEEKFCSSNCKERYDIRRALNTKRALSHTKETNKKRKLFELALNKSRPPDDNQEVVKIKTQFKPIEPKPVESKPSEPKVTTPLKPDTKSTESKPDVKLVSPPKLTIEPILVVDPKAKLVSKQTVDSSTSTESNTTTQKPDPSSLKVNRPAETCKTSVAPKVVIPSEPIKQECPVKTPSADEKKSTKEKHQALQMETTVASSATSTSGYGSEKKMEVFDWCEYLSHMRSHPAWVRLFKDAFPVQPNLFRVGYRLEAIDPQRPSLFCAVSVSQIKGYRLKLHFDGFQKTHNFWVNADSPNIFPCGFCSSHGIDLEPPRGTKTNPWCLPKESFNWSLYLANIKAKHAAPKCFIHKQMDSGEPNLFKVGMKLEAVDKKNSYLVCVATVAAVVDHRILIHFDSWDDSYDYWTEYYSPNIHPVGWCHRNNYVLTPPNGHKRKNFSWRRYLVETGSEAAPDGAFMVRPPVKFKKGSKLEAVDPRAPHLLRVATIKQVLPYQVHIVFDGFPDHFGHWFDDDSPDIHPIGWGTRTGHPLTPPPKPNVVRKCGTPGCQGDGNISSGDLETHSTVADCPYSMDNLEEDNLLPDRLSERNIARKLASSKGQQEGRREGLATQRSRKCRESVDSASEGGGGPVSSAVVTPTTAGAAPTVAVTSPSSDLSAPVSTTSPSSPSVAPATSIAAPVQSLTEVPQPRVPPLNSSPLPPITLKPTQELLKKVEDVGKEAELSAACDKFISVSPRIVTSNAEIKAHQLLDWDSRRVTSFIESILHRATNAFYNNKVDGEGLLMLSEDDLFKRLNFSQLEASFIYSNIVMLKAKFS